MLAMANIPFPVLPFSMESLFPLIPGCQVLRCLPVQVPLIPTTLPLLVRPAPPIMIALPDSESLIVLLEWWQLVAISASSHPPQLLSTVQPLAFLSHTVSSGVVTLTQLFLTSRLI